MLFKNLFTVPTGQKVTEKHLRRVLVSSVCSILLCMSCLVGTTWAWYTVDIENRGNEIQIATVTAEVDVLDGASNAIQPDAYGNYAFETGTYTMGIQLENDATEPQSPVYMVISVSSGGEIAYYYLTFGNGNKAAEQRVVVGTDSATVRFWVSWLRPASATAVNGEAIVIGQVSNDPEEPIAETDPSTAPSTEATEPSTGETEPSVKETEGE